MKFWPFCQNSHFGILPPRSQISRGSHLEGDRNGIYPDLGGGAAVTPPEGVLQQSVRLRAGHAEDGRTRE